MTVRPLPLALLMAGLLGLATSNAFAQTAPPTGGGEEYLFWIDDVEQSVYRGRLDGTKSERVLPPRLPLALAIADGDLYWIEAASKSILRTSIQFAATDTMLTGIEVEAWHRTDIEADPRSGWMFWIGTEEVDGTESRTIYRAEMDGTRVEALMKNVEMPWVVDLVLDEAAKRVYWSAHYGSSGTDAVLSASYDGSDLDTLVVGGSQVHAIAIDTVRQKVYWTTSDRIASAGLDGADPVTAVADVHATDVAVDAGAGMLYWHDRMTGSIYRMNVDGGPVEEVVTDLPVDSEVQDVYFGDAALYFLVRQWTGLTSIMAGDLSATSGASSVVDFRNASELVAGFERPGGLAVDTEAERLYWTDTGGKILHANFDGDEVETIRWGRCPMGALTDVAVDRATRTIYWGEVGDCGEGLHRMALDDIAADPMSYPGPYGVSALALDPISDLIYFADSSPPAAILRIGMNGSGREVVRNEGGTSLAMHPLAYDLYWTNCFEGRIRRSLPNGTNAGDVLTGLDCPTGLVIDADDGVIYWTERHAGRISRAQTDGSGSEVLFSDAGEPTALAATFENRMANLTADTLDWRLYYPLAVGNIWEYSVEDPFAPTYHRRIEITGDTTIAGQLYYIQEEAHYDADSIRTGARFRYLRYSETSETVLEYYASRDTDVYFSVACNLAVPLYPNDDEYHDFYSYLCPAVDGGAPAGPEIIVTGEYTDAHLLVGADSVAYPARKMFCLGGPCTEYFHGIGVPGWLEEGGRARGMLVYLRLNALEAGHSITSIPIEKEPALPDSQPPRLRITPNPTYGDAVIRIDVSRSGSYDFAVFDVTGRRVAQIHLPLAAAKTRMLDWSDLPQSLPAGVYFVRVVGEDGSSAVASVVLVR